MIRTFDFVMTHKLDADNYFINRIQESCAAAELSYFLIEPLWVEHFYAYLEQGAVWPRVLLNMHSEHHDPADIYHRLVRLAWQRQSRIIDPPDLALAACDKAKFHSRLIGSGIHAPYTVVVPREEVATFRLSDHLREAIGTPFVIKPSLGYGRRGVIMDATSEADLVRSEAAWPDSHYLIQRLIVPRQVANSPAYFRTFYVFGSVWSCWWHHETDHYRLLTAAEIEQHELQPLEDIVRRIASVSGMNFFSSEIARVDSGEFVVIDYVNDQCHMLSQSANPQMGVPDELVAAVARRIVEAAREMIRQ